MTDTHINIAFVSQDSGLADAIGRALGSSFSTRTMGGLGAHELADLQTWCDVVLLDFRDASTESDPANALAERLVPPWAGSLVAVTGRLPGNAKGSTIHPAKFTPGTRIIANGEISGCAKPEPSNEGRAGSGCCGIMPPWQGQHR